MKKLSVLLVASLVSLNVFASSQEQFLGSLGQRAQQAFDGSHAAWSKMMALEQKPDFQSAAFAEICAEAAQVQELVKSMDADLRKPEAKRWVSHRRTALRVLQSAALSGSHAAKACATRDPRFSLPARHALVDQSRALQVLTTIL